MQIFFMQTEPNDDCIGLAMREHTDLAVSDTAGGRVMTQSNADAVQSETPGEAALDPKVLEAIGRALKAHYDELVQAPLPEKFLELLARLEAAEPQDTNDASR